MIARRRRVRALFIAVLWCLTGGIALAQGAMKGTTEPLAAVPFAADADVACLASALETGTPSSGPSTWILKAPPGCIVPWHSHSAEEQLIVVAGEVMSEMTDHPPTILGPGGFAMMPGRVAHQFTCQGRDSCLMFVTFDAAYDIKWGNGRP
jgi:mannose-6-phosphate isomerase-like protein (cupin superfamily)